MTTTTTHGKLTNSDIISYAERIHQAAKLYEETYSLMYHDLTPCKHVGLFGFTVSYEIERECVLIRLVNEKGEGYAVYAEEFDAIPQIAIWITKNQS